MRLREASGRPASAPRGRFGGRVVVAALAIAGALAITAPAAAAPAPAPAPAVVANTVEPLTAEGCTGRNGPGNVNKSCVRVKGSGTYVQSIRGWMFSMKWNLLPVTLCGVKVHVWGTYANGARFDRTAQAACSFYGNAYVDWNVNAHFRDGTSVCGRTEYQNAWGGPACVQIRK